MQETSAGRVALVTGASSGIGRATALELLGNGWSVALVALDDHRLRDIERECVDRHLPVLAIPADVTAAVDVRRAFAQASDLGPVEAVFNNAGTSLVAAITETTDEQWQRLLSTNLTGSFNVAREAACTMLVRGRGSIVNTASELALLGQAGYVAYAATKGGILALTRTLAAELAPRGIRVNAVSPVRSTRRCLRRSSPPLPTLARSEGRPSGRSRWAGSRNPKRSPASWPSCSPTRRAT